MDAVDGMTVMAGVSLGAIFGFSRFGGHLSG
jgi:hypothetical protein